MGSKNTSRNRLAGGVCVLALGLAACNGGESGQAEEFEGLEGASFTVGSKQFTEQLILGHMAIMALEEAGASVTDQTGLAGTLVVREALEADEIDMYWEYTGTAWADIFGEDEVIADPEELHTTVADRDLEENGIVWGERGDFENAYALAQNADTAGELGVSTLTDLADLSAESPEEATLCIAEEFAGRADGFPGMSEHYDMQIPDDNITILAEGIIYNEVAEGGDCNFGMVFTTDGRIAALDLEVLEDDESFFPEYNPSITMREEIHEEFPEAMDLMNEVMATLDTEAMQELNLQVDEEGLLPEEVAEEWLTEQGIIG
ncbi:MAG TPA: glycine betaine ABC transporter substrate-binding protein [Beutenbergiaceae bacterium]|nr:glycine betaine ABC transporter substrate-binding protein [Beutenbergiaceae bacterium]